MSLIFKLYCLNLSWIILLQTWFPNVLATKLKEIPLQGGLTFNYTGFPSIRRVFKKHSFVLYLCFKCCDTITNLFFSKFFMTYNNSRLIFLAVRIHQSKKKIKCTYPHWPYPSLYRVSHNSTSSWNWVIWDIWDIRISYVVTTNLNFIFINRIILNNQCRNVNFFNYYNFLKQHRYFLYFSHNSLDCLWPASGFKLTYGTPTLW